MINLNELDRLVDDHIRFDAACSRAFYDDNVPHPNSNPHVFAALHRIRTHVLCGQVDEAVTLADTLCGKSINDPNTQLNIRIHKLIELIYRAESIRQQQDDSQSDSPSLYNIEISKALEYSQQLATYALNAFPEAYSLFKNSMVLFVQPEQIMAPHFISDRRVALANQLVAIVRLTIGARDSDLSFLIRYLLVVYIQFRAPVISRDEETLPLHNLLQQLVNFQLGEEDSGGRITWETDTPSISKLGVPSSFPEEDIQDLPERVGISRQQAIDALKFTEGDVKAALRNELARVKICPKQFRNLIVDYSATRGLAPLKVVKISDLKNMDSTDETKVYALKGMKNGTGELSNGKTVDCDICLASLAPNETRVMISENDLSPSAHAIWQIMCKVHEARQMPNDQAVLSGLRDAAKRGNLCNDATLRFRLAQRETVLAFERGALSKALSIVKNEMGPAETACHGLMPSLRDTLAILACARPKCENDDIGGDEMDMCAKSMNSISAKKTTSSQLLKSWPEDSEASRKFNDMVSGARTRVAEHCSIDSITSCFYSSLEQVHGEPGLVSLLRALLDAHVEWQLQCQRTDRFSAAFSVDALRTVYASTPYVSTDNMEDIESPRAQWETQDQTHSTIGSQVARQGDGDTASEAAIDSRTERLVLNIMEFLELSRPEALSIIRNNPRATNAEAIIESYFGSV